VESGVDFGFEGRSVRVSQEAYSIFLAREAAGRKKIADLQQRLTAADQQIDDLRAELAAVRLGPCKMIVGDELP
jgi:cell division protein FtsB